MDQNLEQNIPLAPIIIGFSMLGATLLLNHYLLKRKHRREGQLPSDGTRTPTVEERVAANPAWARGEIRSAGRGPVIALWLVAIVWNLTFGVSFIKSLSNPEIQTGGIVVLGVFALLGIVPIVFAVRFTMRQLRFGHSWCCIRGKAGVLGNTMTGNVRTSGNIQATGDYTIELQCIESYPVGSGKNRRTETMVHWHEKQIVPRTGQSSSAGIPFSFNLPPHPPETGYQLARGDISWYLRIHAPVKGVDYGAMFKVPVFRVE